MAIPYVKQTVLEQQTTAFEEYRDQVIGHLWRHASAYDKQISKCLSLLKDARDHQRDIFVYGSGFNAELAAHANVDWVKFANIKTFEMGIPTLTAYGNDYAHKTALREYLTHRGFGENSVLVGINIGDDDGQLQDAIDYCASVKGLSVLITNSQTLHSDVTDAYIFIETDDIDLAGDIAQTFTHHIGSNLIRNQESKIKNVWTHSYVDYAYYLVKALDHDAFSEDNLGVISDVIHDAFLSGKSLYAFGNGGSAAMASYFVEHLQKLYEHFPSTLRTIINLSAFYPIIHDSIKQGTYKSDVYSNILVRVGVTEGDILLGISTSGNSGNIIHPFNNFPQLRKIAVLGFGDGGVLGTSDYVDFSVIVPDRYLHRSYAIAEDGQRIALTAILKLLKSKLVADATNQ